MSSSLREARERAWNAHFNPAEESGIPTYDALFDEHVGIYNAQQPTQQQQQQQQQRLLDSSTASASHSGTVSPLGGTTASGRSRSPVRRSAQNAPPLPRLQQASGRLRGAAFPRGAIVREQAAEHGEERREWLATFKKSKKRLQQLWKELHIPDKEQSHFAAQFFEPPSPVNHAHISVMITRLTQHRFATLKTLKAVDVRERLLADLRECERILRVGAADGDTVAVARVVQEHELGTRVGTLLRDLRMATVEAAEAILSWRHGLSRPYPFMWRGTNYVSKMRADVEFLSAGPLSVVLSSLTCLDNPLLLPGPPPAASAVARATGAASRPVRHKDAQLPGVSELDMRRMLAAERVIMEEDIVQQRRREQEAALVQKGVVPTTIRMVVTQPTVDSPRSEGGADGAGEPGEPADAGAGDLSMGELQAGDGGAEHGDGRGDDGYEQS